MSIGMIRLLDYKKIILIDEYDSNMNKSISYMISIIF